MMLKLLSKRLTAGFIIFTISVFSLTMSDAKQQRKILKVSTQDDLAKKVESAGAGTTILLKNGTYKISRPLVFRKPNVFMRSESGNRGKVILDGKIGKGRLKRKNCVNEIIMIMASDVTIADISIRHARDHGIHIAPGQKGNIRNMVMKNIHIYDCGQQLIKVNSNGGKPLYWADGGVLEDSLIEFVDNSIMHDMGDHFYTGGLDVHGGENWQIRKNTFRNIQRKGKMMEHAVHMWSKCRGTIIEQNKFINCFRAVGLGMKRKTEGFTRVYPDRKGNKPYFDHIGGVVRNNFIFNRRGIPLESGIELMNVVDAEIYHNTIVSHDKPFSSIEYRWPNTKVKIINNIVSQRIMKRNNAKAILKNNIENASPDLFKNYKKGNLHLASKSSKAIDMGAPINVKKDIDGAERDPKPDIGADEF
jgi:hypothetical protein